MEPREQDAALAFVESVQLPPAPPTYRSVRRGAELSLEHKQAALVGSDIIAFVDGVTAERRRLVVQSSLLAQLAAKRKVPDATRVFDWYRAYLDVLGNIGWAIQDSTFKNFSKVAHGFEAHEAITQAATALLGPGPALAAVIATIDALRRTSNDQPWFTVFQRESQSASTAHFQVSLVEPEAAGGFLVSLVAFVITAEQGLTQVAFFKYTTDRATLDLLSARVTVGLDPGSPVADAIAQKVASYELEFVRALEL